MFFAAIFRLMLALSGSHYSAASVHNSFLGAMDSIAAGCLLAIYEPQVRRHCRWMTDGGLVIAIPVTAWTLDVVLWGEPSTIGAQSMSALWGVVPLLIALWVFLVIERRDWIFNNPVASTIGVLSYSLYLWQQPFLADRRRSTVVAMLMIAGCAVASYLLVEKPMLKLVASHKWRKPVHEPVQTVARSHGQAISVISSVKPAS